MRQYCDFGWEEELKDGIILCLFRLSRDNVTLGTVKSFERRDAVEDSGVIDQWGDKLKLALVKQLKRLKEELTPEGSFKFIRKKMSLGATADPIAKYLSSMAWACNVKENKAERLT